MDCFGIHFISNKPGYPLYKSGHCTAFKKKFGFKLNLFCSHLHLRFTATDHIDLLLNFSGSLKQEHLDPMLNIDSGLAIWNKKEWEIIVSIK